MNWKERLIQDLECDPEFTLDGPYCSEECRAYDGKRCELMGQRAHPGRICEPAVQWMVGQLDEASESE